MTDLRENVGGDGVTAFVPTLGHAADLEDPTEEHRVELIDLARIVGVAVAAVASLLFSTAPAPVLRVFGASVLLIGAWPVLKEAVENLLERRMTMELSMTIALVAALATGEVFVALVIAAFVLAAELLEEMAVARGRHAIKDLLQYLPRTAVVRRADATEEIPLESLRVGDLVLVNPGSSIPIDGTIVAGTSYVDESTITGEPMPVGKGPGDVVGGVAALPFPDGSFDLVVSTLSMHHWADAGAGQARSAGCSAPVVGPWSGTFGRASCRSTATSPIRSRK